MIKVEKIIPGGQALGTYSDGRKIFFWNALPDEFVTDFKITRQKSHYLEAIATKIENPSPFRVEPKDTCFLSTSPWQIIDFTHENQLKSDLVAEIFREHQITITPPEIITDDQSYYYRNKMEYALYWDNQSGKINLAFHARGSHRKIPITGSSIERSEIFTTAKEIVNDLNRRHEEARKYQSLLLRCNQKGEVSGGLYENHQPHPVFHTLEDTILGYNYSYSPNGFFQINLPVYEMALHEIKKHITTDNVLDLYAGVGTIGLSVARDHHLTLVEVDKAAFNEMTKNIGGVSKQYSEGFFGGCCRERRSSPPVKTGWRDSVPEEYCFETHHEAILARSEDVLGYIEPDQTVILDPPRAGCDRKLIDKFNEIKPTKIIYLSCNPATQARDVKLLLKNYQLKAIKTFNFFPRTPHIENLVILSL